MKKKNGFTLIELMAVITILVILSLIIVPIIDKNVKKSKENMYNIQIDNIRMAGQNYYTDNISLMPINGNYSFVKLDVLIEKGYINKDIKNPKTGKPFEEEIYVQLLNNSGTYEYSVCPLEESCEGYQESGGTNGGFTKVRDINPGIICGEGQEEDYYGNDICYIYSVEDLVEFSNMVSNKYTFTNKTVMLMNNLDLKNPKSYADPNITGFKDINKDGTEQTVYEELSNNVSAGFPTIGNETNKFLGTFNGNANIISNLYMDHSQNMTGLFGYNGGLIKGLILENATIKGKTYTGGIVGYNVGQIKSSRIQGNVTGTNNYVGLISGYNTSGSITDVIADGNVKGNSYVGGILGYNTDGATVKGVYRSGSVSSNGGTDYINKSVGRIYSGTANVVALNTITVTTSSVTTPTSTSLTSTTGYTTNEEGIKNIGIYEQMMDTYIGNDNDQDGYYFDYNEEGIIELYSIEKKPLLITMVGNGTEESPYIINNYEELKQVSYDLSKSYGLNNNIDLKNENQLMLSSNANPFTGTFFGNNKSINNAKIVGINHVGLFGKNSGTISGIKVNDIVVKGNNYVGTISGYNNGIVKGMWIRNNNEVSGKQYTGGTVGYNKGTISSIMIEGNVTGTEYIGMISGYNSAGNILDVVADGNVNGTGDNVGGLLGYNTDSGSLTGIYRSGSVTSKSSSYVNKAVGRIYNGTIKVYALDTIKVTKNGSASTPTGTSFNSTTGYTVNEETLKNIAIFEHIMDTYVGGDNNSDGYYFDYNESGMVELYSTNEKSLQVTMEGFGTESNPYIITNAQQLKESAYNTNLHYKLNANIDLTNENPLILASNVNQFYGSLDGNSYEIKGNNLSGIDNVAFLEVNNGTIKNLNLKDFTVSGKSNVGGLTGKNNGIIENVSIDNFTVNGTDNVGALAGYNSNEIKDIIASNSTTTGSNCTGIITGYNNKTIKGIKVNDSNITGKNYCGLLTGYNASKITGTIVKGNVSGTSYVGLAAGQNDYGTVESIVSGNVTGTNNYASGIVGYENSGTTSGIYLEGNVNGYSGATRTVYRNSSGTHKGGTIALNTIKVNGMTLSSTSTSDSHGYSAPVGSLNNIAMNDAVLDTYVGGDNNNDVYYYDYNSEGIIDIYSVETKPLTITMEGTGTAESPYIINNYDELKQAAYNQSAHYKLNADIDLTGKNPIILGGYSNVFKGTFEGNGYEISNMTLIGFNSVGVFGNNQGTVKGLKLKNVDVTGNNYVGVISGYNSGKITTTKSSGSATGVSYIGLAAGQNTGTVESIVSGNVTGTGNYASGIVGYENSGTTSGIYLEGNVNGYSGATRTVYRNSSGTHKGGTIALNTIKVNGMTLSSTSTSDSHGYSAPVGSLNNIAMNDAVLDTYVGGDNNNDVYYYDYNSEGIIDIYSVETKPLTITMEGTGTAESPYIINNYDELKQAAYNQSAHYKLNADIDLTGKNPIILGGYSNVFKGTFEGNGYEISNMTLIGFNSVGVFGNNQGTVKGLKLKNVDVTGNNYVGVISGYNSGKITTTKSSGSATGASYIGLAAGQNSGGNIEVIVSGNVTGTGSFAGGIVGIQYSGTTKGIYQAGNVIGNTGVNRTIYRSDGSRLTIALNSIKVNGSTSSSTSIDGDYGYSTSQESLNNIALNDAVLDTYIAGDNNSDGYYFGNNSEGIIDVYSIERNPLTITMSGNGTAESPYIINNYDELKQATYNLNAYYALNNNIDLTGKNPITFGTYSNAFKGTFEGNGYEISNMTLMGYTNTGVFGYNIGTVKGIKLKNISSSGYSHTGIIAGYNGGTIKTVLVDNGSASGVNHVGLAAGQNNNSGSITEVVTSGNVKGTGSFAAGITGIQYSGTTKGAFIGGSVSGNTGVNRTIYRSGGNRSTIALDSILINGSTSSSTSLTSDYGKSYTKESLLTAAPYEQLGFNFTETDPTKQEYIWYFTTDENPTITFRKN